MKRLTGTCLLASCALALSGCEPTALTDPPEAPGAAAPSAATSEVSGAPIGDPIVLHAAEEAIPWRYAYPLAVGPTGRYLVDATGRPFHLVGDAAWSLMVQPTKSEAAAYLASRRAMGFDAVLTNLIEHRFATNAPANINGVPPFTGKTFTTPNPAYFAHVDDVIQSAADNGILVLLSPLYLGGSASLEGWYGEVEDATEADLNAWGRWVGSRYERFGNIMWVIGGDADPTAVASKVEAMVDGILSADTRHLLTAHNRRGQAAILPWRDASWLDVNNVYASRSGTDYAKALLAYHLHPLPFFLIESVYDGEGPNAQELRYQTYGTGLSGSFGHVYGNCPVWHFNAPTASNFCDDPGSTWQSQLGVQGALNMRYARLLFESRNWEKLVPDQDHVAVTSGLGTEGQVNYVTAAYASDGSSIIAYMPSARAVTVDGDVLAGSTMKVWWYHPGSGVATAAGTFPTSTPRSFTPPGSGDWVLVVDDAGRGFGAPGALGSSGPANEAPTAAFTQTCTLLSCSFSDASSDADGTVASRSWTFGDGGASGVRNPLHTYAAPGTYTVRLTVTDDDGATATLARNVTVSAPESELVVSFSYSCVDLACAFTNTSTQPFAQLWWTLGDGTSAGGESPTHTYAAAGSYSVTLSMVVVGTYAQVSHTESVTVTVTASNAPPTAAFTHACTDLSCNFTDTSSDEDGSIVSRSWAFGDGGTSTTRDPGHTYAAAGTYTVALTVRDDDGAKTTVARSVTVTAANVRPTATFTYGCTDLRCDFTDGSSDSDGTIVSRSWDFGDGTGSSVRHPDHTYAAGGTYRVRLRVTDDDGASRTFARDVTVSAPPEAPVVSFSHECAGLVCTFTDTSTYPVDGIWWDLGDGAFTFGPTPTHAYAAAGSYEVTLGIVVAGTNNQAFHTKSITVGGEEP
jgi:PKD repeat protein